MIDFFSLPSEEKERVLRSFEKRMRRGNKNECWIWEGNTNSRGYGAFTVAHRINGQIKWQIYVAHRLSWMLHWNLPIPKGLFCCHTCDVSDCANPHHLVLGTPKTNAIDMMSRDRKMKVKRHVRLAIADAVMAGMTHREAAKKFNIPRTNVHTYLQCKEVRDKYGIIDLRHRVKGGWFQSKKKVMHGQTTISDTQIHSIPNPL